MNSIGTSVRPIRYHFVSFKGSSFNFPGLSLREGNPSDYPEIFRLIEETLTSEFPFRKLEDFLLVDTYWDTNEPPEWIEEKGHQIPYDSYREYFFKDIEDSEDPRGYLHVVIDSNTGQIVATAALTPHPDDKQIGYISKMYTLPPYRGRGLATWFLKDLEAKAKKMGYTKLKLSNHTTFTNANRLYKRYGFEALKTQPHIRYILMEKEF